MTIKNETITFSESTNTIEIIEKIINVPILGARVHDYYLFVKEDFKNIIKLTVNLYIHMNKQIHLKSMQ
ncbi:hypothetical protein NEPAR06_2347 [Nematocida parisii]|uniref:Uncharacterized protein n=1 Tax=Nematocida parisii (strain ERTm3) TaxID=935791 RepID=I3ED72_NEMP3|nr:uncharacterized protein NEPG_02596 [Nematocida parisii ERTm1]EIJ87169.1 hypothetical protein NEQG_02626 [Nematocida parisii ERTm3]KAI5146347.1 hypothetical protein NEPAR07_2310 [Nematocida parisii]EIJ92527.1 hypothetical protein NEPG_02596 [Nematocida parisii ERTm1]KAI5157026.1 hypothetical protein NEPAR06_2347 [Nematocida parisii]KAI5157218.1 hypothetical protein NEPAR05_1100 [Nematocida parisii]|eukprot:XP_013060423.1 hypothetical protein NEPG_02596 [Nematocida parisii ERTm1]